MVARSNGPPTSVQVLALALETQARTLELAAEIKQSLRQGEHFARKAHRPEHELRQKKRR